jgi:similar to spore coat protein
MDEQCLSLHETMQVHEMLNFKTVCMTTSKMLQGIVFDQDLKALMAKDVNQSIVSIADLQHLLSKAPTLN